MAQSVQDTLTLCKWFKQGETTSNKIKLLRRDSVVEFEGEAWMLADLARHWRTIRMRLWIRRLKNSMAGKSGQKRIFRIGDVWRGR
jgi:hypothetical protein